jgi:hypothetical protein
VSKHVAKSDRLILSSIKNAVAFRTILISFCHITDTERNITRKLWETCYKEYRDFLCSGNSGITICTKATLTKFYTIFLRISMNYK